MSISSAGRIALLFPSKCPLTQSSSGSLASRSWDATPRTSSSQTPRTDRRGGRPGEDFTPNMREWEEEQVKLDRDWYESEGGVVRRAAFSLLYEQSQS
jgi:hypothetical protein